MWRLSLQNCLPAFSFSPLFHLFRGRQQKSGFPTWNILLVKGDIVCCPKGNFWDWKCHCLSLHWPVYNYRCTPTFDGSTFLTLWWCEYNKHSVETILWSFPGLASNQYVVPYSFVTLGSGIHHSFQSATRSQGETRGTLASICIRQPFCFSLSV